MKYLSLIVAALCLLSSCAYMQTNKSVAEIGASYVGAEVNQRSIELYSRAGEWYIAAPKVTLKRHYPVIYDSIYLDRNNEPTESVVRQASDGAKLYMPISAGTAKVLQLKDGYAELPSLIAESRSSGIQAREELSGARNHRILAQLENRGTDTTYYVSSRNPEQPGSGILFLSKLDKYTIDVIGTVAYNVAIPFMAPFRFFSEFLTED